MAHNPEYNNMDIRANRLDKTIRTVICVSAIVLALFLPRAPSVVYGRWEIPEAGTRAYQKDIEEAIIEGDEEATTLGQVTVPILMYHYVSELPLDADRYRVNLTVEPVDFIDQLRYLRDAGFHTITLNDLYLNLTQDYPLPDKPVVLTFDDGYRDAYDIVFPALLEFGFNGTFFILATPAHFESPQYLTWAQMAEMAEAGMEIQSHGRDHVDLSGQSYDYLVYQTVGVQEAILYHTGRAPRYFCYPSGRYDDDVIAVLKSAGYWGAVTTQWGVAHNTGNLFEMPRVRIQNSTSLESFADLLE